MNKKVIEILVVVAVLSIVGIGTMLLHDKSEKENQANNDVNENNMNNTLEENQTSDSKVLVVYYSATHNTENVAKKIAENVNGDIFEIVPKEEYTSEDLSWTNENSRVSKEHTNEFLRNVELKNKAIA